MRTCGGGRTPDRQRLQVAGSGRAATVRRSDASINKLAETNMKNGMKDMAIVVLLFLDLVSLLLYLRDMLSS